MMRILWNWDSHFQREQFRMDVEHLKAVRVFAGTTQEHTTIGC